MKTARNLVIVICACLLGGAAIAGSLNDVKARMEKRLSTVNALKTSKIVGEDNQGYLAFVGDKKEKADVVEAENADRKIVYEAIAEKLNSTAEAVGRQRAKQIAERSDAGIMLQDANGTWYEKK